jgi:methionyl-tRNA formyltransferase
MRIVFMGTSPFAVPTLSALLEKHDVVAVVTQPDRPSGRGQHVHESPVKKVAQQADALILQPEKVRDEGFVARMRELGPLDAIVVAAFGQIIPKSILDMPRLGCVNVHASLLPKYRGAAPIHHAIMNGETVTGVTTMLMDPGLDTGAILLKQELAISLDDNTGDLEPRLADFGAGLLIRTLDELNQGAITPIPQDSSLATLAPSLKKEEAAVDWNQPASAIVNRIRAFTPRPGAFTHFKGSAVKILRATVGTGEGAPGTVVGVSEDGITVAAGDGAIILVEVQPENKKRMTAAEYARGARIAVVARFGSSDAVLSGD